jgi:hypothetical protein
LDKVDFVKVRILIQQKSSHCSATPYTLLAENRLTITIKGVVTMREGNGNMVPGIKLKEAGMFTERDTRALGLCIHQCVHTEELHVVGSAQELGAPDLNQPTPRISCLQIHPEGESEHRGGTTSGAGKDRGGETGVVFVSSVGVEDTFANLTKRGVRDVCNISRVD